MDLRRSSRPAIVVAVCLSVLSLVVASCTDARDVMEQEGPGEETSPGGADLRRSCGPDVRRLIQEWMTGLLGIGPDVDVPCERELSGLPMSRFRVPGPTPPGRAYPAVRIGETDHATFAALRGLDDAQAPSTPVGDEAFYAFPSFEGSPTVELYVLAGSAAFFVGIETTDDEQTRMEQELDLAQTLLEHEVITNFGSSGEPLTSPLPSGPATGSGSFRLRGEFSGTLRGTTECTVQDGVYAMEMTGSLDGEEFQVYASVNPYEDPSTTDALGTDQGFGFVVASEGVGLRWFPTSGSMSVDGDETSSSGSVDATFDGPPDLSADGSWTCGA
jgi:hypothetical protein